jgi:hypothetical protein
MTRGPFLTRRLADRLAARGAAVEERTVPGRRDTGTWHALAGPMLESLLSTGSTR